MITSILCRLSLRKIYNIVYYILFYIYLDKLHAFNRILRDDSYLNGLKEANFIKYSLKILAYDNNRAWKYFGIALVLCIFIVLLSCYESRQIIYEEFADMIISIGLLGLNVISVIQLYIGISNPILKAVLVVVGVSIALFLGIK